MNEKELVPYSGSEKYAYVKFCPEDRQRVQGLLKAMIKNGWRIRFDSEKSINPEGDEEENFENCYVVIFFITENSVNSHPFRQLITRAVFEETKETKHRAFVHIEQVNFSLGMELQRACACNIDGYRMSQNAFLQAGRSEPVLMPVIGPIPEPVIEFYLQDVKTGKKYRLTKDKIRIGRLPQACDMVVDNIFVGRCHALINVFNGNCYVTDNNSKNKTKVNGQPLDPGRTYMMHDGDDVAFADEHFRFIIEKEED